MKKAPRQKALYDLLMQMSDRTDYISKQEIANLLPNYYTFYTDSQRNCVDMEEDVRSINNNDEYDHIVISNKNGYKIGSKEETENYIRKLFKRDFKSLKRNYRLAKKCRLDNQLQITEDGMNINKIETFINV